MKCILHIGWEKTGTTSIQSFVKDNNELLAKHDVYCLKNAGFPNVVRLPVSCMAFDRNEHYTMRFGIDNDIPKRKSWCEEVHASVTEELQEAKRLGFQTVLIGSEYFSSKLVAVDEIVTLKKLLSDAGVREFQVVVYLRNQLEFQISRQSTSMVASTIFAGMSNPWSRPLLDTKNWLLNYERLLDMWAEVFSEESMVVRLFDKNCLLNGDVVEDFFSYVCNLELPEQTYISSKTTNQSLSEQAQMTIASVNKHLDSVEMEENEKRRIRRKILDYLEENHVGEPFRPDREDCIEFQNAFREANERLSKKWFDGREILNCDLSKYPRSSERKQYGFDDGVDVMLGLLLAEI